MFWTGRTNRVTGITLLLIPFLSIVGFATASAIGELDPFAPGDVEEMLRTINEHPGLFAASLVPFVITDVLVLPAAAALLYLTFRGRSQMLAMVGAFAILAAAAAFVIHETGAVTLPFLAADFFGGGGPGPVGAGDPVILYSARTISVFQASAALYGQTTMGFGFLAFGALIAWAPGGDTNPPRWLGALGIAGGVASLCTWSFLLNHTAGGIFTLVGELAAVVMMGVLGVWLLRQADLGARELGN